MKRCVVSHKKPKVPLWRKFGTVMIDVLMLVAIKLAAELIVRWVMFHDAAAALPHIMLA
jgi:hypothetical protein